MKCFFIILLYALYMSNGLLGRLVKVSSFRPMAKDSTLAIQSALDSGANTVVLDNVGYDYVTNCLHLRSNQRIILEDGVVLRAKRGCFHGTNDCLLSGVGISNVTLEGHGRASLCMNRLDYDNPKNYIHSEWRHLLSLINCTNITVRNLSLNQSGGDGIYLGGRGTQNGCRDILLENLQLSEHYRQGISVISVDGLIIRNCQISNTRGTPPMDGIDFEPNSAGQYLRRILLENCNLSNNANNGLEFAIVFPLKHPLDAVIRHCKLTDNKRNGLNLILGGSGNSSEPLTGTLFFEDCRITGSTPLLGICDQSEKGVKLRFRGCVFDNRVFSGSSVVFNSRLDTDIGRIDFGDTVFLRDNLDIKKLVCVDGRGSAGFGAFEGSLTVCDSHGRRQTSDLSFLSRLYHNEWSSKYDKIKVKAINPVQYIPGKRDFKEVGIPLRLRHKNTLLFYACTGEHVHIDIEILFLPNHFTPQVRGVLTDGSGIVLDRFHVNQKSYRYSFTSRRTGMFMLKLSSRGESYSVKTSASGQGYVGNPLRLFGRSSRLYFVAPRECTEVAIQIIADPNEYVSAEIRDAFGLCRAKVGRFAGTKILHCSRAVSSEDDVWELRLNDAVEDHQVRLLFPLEPIFYTKPQHRLIKSHP